MTHNLQRSAEGLEAHLSDGEVIQCDLVVSAIGLPELAAATPDDFVRIASGLGPMYVMPSRALRAANSASSATNPLPTHTASAPVSRSARSAS